MNILIGEISSYKAIVLCKFIKNNYPNCKLYTYDFKKFTRQVRTKYSDHHILINRSTLMEELIEISDKYNIDYFFPVINENLSQFWRNKDLFDTTLNYLGGFDEYEKLNDKMLLYEIASKLKLLVPKTHTNINHIDPPYVVKPKNLSSAKGVYYIFDRSEEDSFIMNSDNIFQEYVDGIGVGYSFYCKEGVIFNGYGHKRLAEFPVTGGSSTYREKYNDERMHEIASVIVRYLNYTGFAMFEFKLTSKNELYLIEVNPRIWGSINQGLANGVNYFEKILGSVNINQSKSMKNINTYISPLIYLSFLKYLLKLNIQPILFFIKNISKNKSDVNLFDDPFGYISTILRKLI